MSTQTTPKPRKPQTAAVVSADQEGIISSIVINGDLSRLNPQQKVSYYRQFCERLGLDPLSQPFKLLRLNGKEVMYCDRSGAQQLNKLHQVSHEIKAREIVNGCYVVTAQAATAGGRHTESIGAVPIENLKGDALCNAMMKAECCPLDYEILTARGFKLHSEVELGDEVAAYDIASGRLEWVPLEEKSIYPAQPVTEYGNSGIAFEITAGHKFVGAKCGLTEFENITNDYIVVAAMNEADEDESLLTSQEAALLGWIVTDGTIKQYNGKPYTAHICQSKTEHFAHIAWACEAVGPVKESVTYNRDYGWRDQHWWHLSVEQTRDLFERAGYTSDADLCGIIADLGRTAREAMYEAMVRADGDKKGVFGKCDPRVIDAFQMLAALLGKFTGRRLRFTKRATKPIALVKVYDHDRVHKRNLPELSRRITDVWCPTTAHGTWVCRTTDGYVLITGNTKAKRRSTLDLLGLGILDESETETIANAVKLDAPAGAEEQPAQPAEAKPVSPFKCKYDTAEEIMAALTEAGSVQDIANLYYINAEVVEGSKEMKDAFSARKNEFYNAPAPKEPVLP